MKARAKKRRASIRSMVGKALWFRKREENVKA